MGKRVLKVTVETILSAMLLTGFYYYWKDAITRKDNRAIAYSKTIKIMDGLRPKKFPGSWPEIIKQNKRIEQRAQDALAKRRT
jgi:hypothetical protein